jgi:hypothetical protein
MSNKKTGGPAFPTEVWDSEGVPQHTEGMTLRDYFAAKAMEGNLSNERTIGAKHCEVALHAYTMADAMLAAREAK